MDVPPWEEWGHLSRWWTVLLPCAAILAEYSSPLLATDAYADDKTMARGDREFGATLPAPLFTTDYFLNISTNCGSTIPTSGWYPEGTMLTIEWVPPAADPDTRCSFNGWAGTGPGSYTGVSNPTSIMMVGPVTEVAVAIREFRFTFDTVPTGITIVIDGAMFPAPVNLWWLEGSVHSVLCPSPHAPGGGFWVFDRWDDGVTDNPRTFLVAGPETRSCFNSFVMYATFDARPVTSVTNLSLVVNGTGVPPPGLSIRHSDPTLGPEASAVPRTVVPSRPRSCVSSWN